MNKKIIISTIIIFAGAAVWYFFGSSEEKKYVGPAEKVIMGVDFSDMLSTPVLIAENLGYFKEEGLDVQIMEYPSGRTALVDMVEGANLDMVTSAQTPVMYNSFASNNYAIIAGMSSSHNAGALVLARQDKGIRTALDLKGKKIGTPIGSTGHFFLNLFLLYNGLKISDIELIDMEATNLPQALTDGGVDAIAIWQPQIYKAQKLLGEKAIILPSENIYRVDFYLISNKDFINDKPEALSKLLKAVNKAQDFIKHGKEASIDIVSNRLSLDGDVVAALWDDYQFKIFLDQAILTDLEDEARWAIREGLAGQAEVPNFLDYIYLDALEKVKPEAVTIIK